MTELQHQYQREPVKPLIQVLCDWRNDTAVKATLGVLEQALDNVGRGGIILCQDERNIVFQFEVLMHPVFHLLGHHPRVVPGNLTKDKNILLKVSSTNSLNLSHKRL
jgi:hypothetical protein